MATASAVPDQPFLCATPAPGRAYHPDGVELTYAAVRAEVLRLKAAYAHAGYGHGHRIALLFENRPEFFFHYLAANALGMGVVPVNPDYRHDELAYQMDHSGGRPRGVGAGARGRARGGGARARSSRSRSWTPSAWPASLPRPAPAPRRGTPGPDTECGLLYTSGTTGRPKGCVLSNFYYLNAGAWYRGLGGRLAIEPGRERFLNPLPLFHMNCQAVTATCAILTGNCLILPERFSPRRWWPDVVATRATIIHYLGVMPPLLLNQAPIPEETAHRVKAGLGAGVEPELHEAFERRFGFPLVEVWGMTETGRIFSDCHEPRSIHTRAFGRPHGGLEARVVDDQGRDVAARDRGRAARALGRARGSAPRLLLRLPRQRRGHRGGVAGGVVPHRRRGPAGRRRHARLRGPQEEHHPAIGREHRRRRGGSGAPGPRGGGPGRGARGAGRDPRGGGHGLRGADAGRDTGARPRRAPGRPLPRAPGLLQGARLGALRGATAHHRHPEGPEGPDLPPGRGSARRSPGRSTSAAARSAAESAGAGPSAHALQSTAWLFPNGPHVWPRSCVAASWSWTARWAP